MEPVIRALLAVVGLGCATAGVYLLTHPKFNAFSGILVLVAAVMLASAWEWRKEKEVT